MDDLGPLSVLYCWQSCVLAFLITTGTHGIKAFIDYRVGGKETRQQSLLINSIILPATPIVLGGLLGGLIPLWPEILTEYLKAHAVEGWHAKLAFAAYGAAVGQFADYVWNRYSSVVDGVKAKALATAAASNAVTPPMGTPVAPAVVPAADPAPAPAPAAAADSAPKPPQV